MDDNIYRAIVYTHILESDDWTFDHPQQGRCVVRVAGQVRCNNGAAAIPLPVTSATEKINGRSGVDTKS